MPGQDGNLDLAAVKDRLSRERGRTYWRSLEELAGTDGFREMLHREFPSLASRLDGPLVRRDFLRYMGASLALAGLTGCTRQPAEAKPAPRIRSAKPRRCGNSRTEAGR